MIWSAQKKAATGRILRSDCESLASAPELRQVANLSSAVLVFGADAGVNRNSLC